jgi:hypothetical protein
MRIEWDSGFRNAIECLVMHYSKMGSSMPKVRAPAFACQRPAY